MPFLEDLIKRGRFDGRGRHSEDRSLTGEGDTYAPRGSGVAAPRARKSGLLSEVREGERSRVCGNTACGFGFTMPWKSREHPIFEGRWACSRRCLAAMVRASLSQEADDTSGDDGPQQHQHRIPLGLIMLAQGWITHPELQRALEAQRQHGSGRIGDWLVSECGMKPERVARGLSVQWNCPVLSTESFWPEAMALALPRLLLEEYGAVPLRLAGRKTLYVGFQDGLDASASFALEQMTGLRTESGLLPEAEFGRARKILLGCEFPEQSFATVSDRDGLARSITETIEHEQPEASRLVRLHRHYWLRVWAKDQGDRAAGDLPANVAGARDYLFAIGSRAARSIHTQRPYEQVTVPDRAAAIEADEAVEEPMAAEAEAILSEVEVQESRSAPPELPEPLQSHTAQGEIALEELAVEAAVVEAAVVEEATVERAIVSGALVEVSTVEAVLVEAAVVDGAIVRCAAVDGAAVEAAVFEADALEDLLEAVKSAEERKSATVAEELPTPRSLARQESWFAEEGRLEKRSPRGQIVRPEELDNLQRFMRRSYETEIEPVDGEYLFELTSLESSALVSADRASGWGRLGQLLKPRLSVPSSGD